MSYKLNYRIKILLFVYLMFCLILFYLFYSFNLFNPNKNSFELFVCFSFFYPFVFYFIGSFCFLTLDFYSIHSFKVHLFLKNNSKYFNLFFYPTKKFFWNNILYVPLKKFKYIDSFFNENYSNFNELFFSYNKETKHILVDSECPFLNTFFYNLDVKNGTLSFFEKNILYQLKLNTNQSLLDSINKFYKEDILY